MWRPSNVALSVIGENTWSEKIYIFDSATVLRSLSFFTFGLEVAESKLLESTVMALVTMVTLGWLEDDVESLMTWSRFDGDAIMFDCCSYVTSSVASPQQVAQENNLRFGTTFLLVFFLFAFFFFLLRKLKWFMKNERKLWV